MGRKATGFHVRWRAAKGAWYVRFTIDGQRVERCTAIRDREASAAAQRAGREEYAKAVREGVRKRRAAPTQKGLDWWLSAWVEQLDDVRDDTRELYERYGTYWLRELGSFAKWTSVAMESYVKARLRVVGGKAVRNELSALRKFTAYALSNGALVEAPTIPSLQVSVSGKRWGQRRRTRAPELSPSECKALLDALPEKSSRDGWLIRARFGAMYETTLRPKTLDRLAEGVHYSKGASSIILTDDDDKELYGREVPLTKAATRWLDSACTGKKGHLLFGWHRYDPYIQAVAKKVLDDRRAGILCGQHFRSAAITHYLERTGNLPGVQYLAGHKHASTTARYVRASLRAAKEVIGAR